MTYESDLQLRALRLKPLADLPNRSGFQFIGVERDMNEVKCFVYQGADCLHKVAGARCSDLIGWRNA